MMSTESEHRMAIKNSSKFMSGEGGLIVDRPLTMARQRNAVKATNALNGIITAYQEDDLIETAEYRALIAALAFIESVLTPAFVITNEQLSIEALKAHLVNLQQAVEEMNDDIPF